MKAKAMGKATVTLFLMLIVSLFLTSCSGVVTPELQLDPEEDINKVEETGFVYLDVPYEKYAGVNWCLPASGAMTFKYFKENISQAEIADAVIEDGSSSVYKIIKYAKDLGFEAKYNYMTIEEIKYLLKKDIPVIVVQNYSLTLPYSHARVIIGFDDEEQEVISNDPTAGKDYKMSYSNFAALNTGINPDLFKIIVISTEEIDVKNAELIDNTDNSKI
jgi:ABC-type bacteriocin/lantibiotic exporter with double-glycine peptidase domain